MLRIATSISQRITTSQPHPLSQSTNESGQSNQMGASRGEKGLLLPKKVTPPSAAIILKPPTHPHPRHATAHPMSHRAGSRGRRQLDGG